MSGTSLVAGGGESAYVYDLGSATPSVPIATLNNPDPTPNDLFGRAVAISDRVVLVGAPYDDTLAGDAGSAYLYDLASATPTTPVATLDNPDPPRGSEAGVSVAVSGTRMVVGAWRDDAGAGRAYVYDLTSATPTVPVFALTNPSPASGTAFGYSVAISDGLVVVAAPFFPHRLAQGYSNPMGLVLQKLNGTPVRSLTHLVELLRDQTAEFVTLEFEGPFTETLVFSHKEMLAATEAILTDNGVRSQGSPDTLAVWNLKSTH